MKILEEIADKLNERFSFDMSNVPDIPWKLSRDRYFMYKLLRRNKENIKSYFSHKKNIYHSNIEGNGVRDKKIFFYYLADPFKRTPKLLSEKYGLSQSRIRQILNRCHRIIVAYHNKGICRLYIKQSTIDYHLQKNENS